jgi:cellulose biosynthesis protein BcsQ
MNSVVSVASVEAVFAGRGDSTGQPIKPIYLLNQFDPSLALHADVRAILQQQLGSRLLPFVLRRSPAVSEALAEGMTVMDYAPNSPMVEDYVQLANWLGSVSPVTTTGFRRVRWSER